MDPTWKVGPIHRWKNLEVFALNGTVAIEDQSDGDFKVLHRSQALDRAKAFFNESKSENRWQDQRDELRKIAEILETCADECVRQGDVENKEIFRKKVDEMRQAARSRFMVNRQKPRILTA